MKFTILAAAMLAATYAGATWSHTEAPRAGAQKAVSVPIPGKEASGGTRDARTYFTDLELQTQDGRKVRFYSDVLEGKTVLINVIYTNCKDACPMITQQLLDVRKRLGESAKNVHFVTLT